MLLPNSWNQFLHQKNIFLLTKKNPNTMGVKFHPDPRSTSKSFCQSCTEKVLNPRPGQTVCLMDFIENSPSIKLKLSTRSTWQQALLKICENLWKRLEINPNIWLLNMPCSISRLCASLLSEKNWSRMSVMYVIKNVSSGLSSSNLSCQPVVVG